MFCEFVFSMRIRVSSRGFDDLFRRCLGAAGEWIRILLHLLKMHESCLRVIRPLLEFDEGVSVR